MGVDKATVEVAGATMLDHVVAALRSVAGRVVVAGRALADGVDATIPDDDEPFRGPLAGVAAAARAHSDSLLVVVAVDQPWVRPATLAAMIELVDLLPVVPVDAGARQTTCAVYPAAALEGIDEELRGGGSIQSLLDRVSFRPVTETAWRTWGEDGRSWFSVDTSADLEAGLDRFGTPGAL